MIIIHQYNNNNNSNNNIINNNIINDNNDNDNNYHPVKEGYRMKNRKDLKR